jgi:hypothetical protein
LPSTALADSTSAHIAAVEPGVGASIVTNIKDPTPVTNAFMT